MYGVSKKDKNYMYCKHCGNQISKLKEYCSTCFDFFVKRNVSIKM